MPPKSKKNDRKRAAGPLLLVLTIILLLAIAGAALYWYRTAHPRRMAAAQDAHTTIAPTPDRIAVKKNHVIEIDGEKQDSAAKAEMIKRKERYGVHDAVDAIVKPDEMFRVGDKTVSMQKIADEIRLKEGGIIENTVDASGGKQNASEQTDYGIYIVQASDNIWNLHFRFLTDYFKRRGVNLSPSADEPGRKGFSSGVGKLLKFSENKVYIYNLRKERFDSDIHLIHPNDKIVIYNMKKIFNLLNHIGYEQVARIQFDGETLWVPSVEE